MEVKWIADNLLRRLSQGKCRDKRCMIYLSHQGPSAFRDECRVCVYIDTLPKGMDE